MNPEFFEIGEYVISVAAISHIRFPKPDGGKVGARIYLRAPESSKANASVVVRGEAVHRLRALLTERGVVQLGSRS